MKSTTTEKEVTSITSNYNVSPSANCPEQKPRSFKNVQYPPYYHFKKTFLQVVISLDIISWILFDLFVQYYADQFVRLNTQMQVDTDEFYHLKVNMLDKNDLTCIRLGWMNSLCHYAVQIVE